MLSEHNIYAMSPSIGSNDTASQTNFINDTAVLLSVVQQNDVWITFTIRQLFPEIFFSQGIYTINDDLTQAKIYFNMDNMGLGTIQS